MEFPPELFLKIKAYEYQLHVSDKIKEIKRVIKYDISTTFYLGKIEHTSVAFQVSYLKRWYEELVSWFSESDLITLVKKELVIQRSIYD